MAVVTMKQNKSNVRAKATGAKAPGYRMAARGKTGEIYLYGVVGQTYYEDGVSAKQFADDLNALGDVTQIDLRINSDGGNVFDGRTIYTLLKQHPAQVTSYVDGWAASIASLIAMAGDKIIMGEGTFMMIHSPWSGIMGNAIDMRRMADQLDTIEETMIQSYATRSGQKPADIKGWLDAETLMTAEETVARGFADTIADQLKIAAIVRNPGLIKPNMPLALRPNRAAAQAAMERFTASAKS